MTLMKKYLLAIMIICAGFSFLEGVVVSNATELQNAVSNANSGGDTTIILTNGTYTLDSALGIWADNVTVRSQSGSRGSVTIRGQGMYGGVSHIFNVAGTNFTARDMTIGWVANHAIQIWGNNNSSNTLLRNLRIVDCYEQMVKISYDSSSPNYSANGVMEYCLLEYSAKVGPQWYIGGIDGHACRNWTVRNNTFKYISSPSGDVAEHAVHFWSNSQNTVVENNLIIDCDRGIGFGLGSRGHIGGTIRNNMIYHSSTNHGFADVGIGLENCSNAKVYNNTIYFANSYPYAIEYRFSGTTGCTITNNLCNKAIQSRDGGSATLTSNLTNAVSSWFENVNSGDLHLASEVAQVVDQGTAVSGLSTDYDGDSRPQGAGIDIGADEYTSGAVVTPTLTVTSPNGGESWTGGTYRSITWSTTGTVGNVKIEYSTNNGGSWSTITSSTANDGAYSWEVPNITSNQCLVRIGEASDNNPTDTSNAVFSITAPSQATPSILLSRSQLFFGCTTGGTKTSSQTFSVENDGDGTLNWSASTSTVSGGSWLSCSPASGSGYGEVTVSVNVSGLDAGTYSGTVSVSDSSADNSPQTVAVTLKVYASGANGAPFGEFETPKANTTVAGSIPVTGWVLDDIEVKKVEIFSGSTFIDTAVFVEGARPDVEAAFDGYPLNTRAGWGYMLLTNYLPGGGQGYYTLTAKATDAEGNTTSLGSKRILVDNANAVKPFGAIDTPSQGGTATGTGYRIWGWVLTPMPNAIPSDGSTIGVIVNGVKVGNPVYNLYRPDIAGYFPGYANTDGASGYFDLDTTQYENGVYTIQWTVSDDAGNTDGIGSRFFTIQNTGNRAAQTNMVHRGCPGNKRHYLTHFKLTHFKNIKKTTLQTRELERVVYRLDHKHPGETLNKRFQKKRYEGFLLSGKKLKELPIGSTLDRERGIFYWSPGPGFYGTYRIVFIDLNSSVKQWNLLEIRIFPRFPD